MGNTSVQALLQRWDAERVVTIQRKEDGPLYDLMKKGSVPANRHKIIREVLENFTWDGWQFPRQASGDGCMGLNTISASRIVPVVGATDDLALHLNFMISYGRMDKVQRHKRTNVITGRGRFRLTLSLLHLTARTKGTQITISDNGGSKVTAGASIHCGPGNDWDWGDDENAKELSRLLNVDVGAVQTALQLAGFNSGMAYMAGAKAALEQAILAQGQANYPNVDFEVSEKDNTWK
ncbi:MAG: hypothetical protein ACRDQU_10430 [Pseudonocardiaceae bacterium]